MSDQAQDPSSDRDEPARFAAPQNVELLPEWYMPAGTAGTPLLRGWRRRVALLVVVSFVLISAFGLCSTYGRVAFG